MSDKGTFFQDMWLVKPSWWQKLRLRGRMTPYPNWLQVSGQLAAIVGFGAITVLSSSWVGSWQDGTLHWDRMILMTAAALDWLFLCNYLVKSPNWRSDYRDKLIRKGKLLSPENPVGRMVLLPKVREYWEQNPAQRWKVSRLLGEFASMMAGYQRLFCRMRWYLDDGEEQRRAWLAVASLHDRHPGPIQSLGILCGIQDELFKHVDDVVVGELQLQRAILQGDEAAICSRRQAVYSEISRLSARACDLDSELEENRAKQRYEPPRLFQHT